MNMRRANYLSARNFFTKLPRLWLSNLFFTFRQKFFRNRIVGAFFVPRGGGNPPARAVPVKLDAVDAATLFLAVGGRKFVNAKNVRDVAETPDDTVDFAFLKTFGDKKIVRAVDVLHMIHDRRPDFAVLLAQPDKTHVRHIQSFIARPLTRNTFTARNRFVK